MITNGEMGVVWLEGVGGAAEHASVDYVLAVNLALKKGRAYPTLKAWFMPA